MEVFIVLLAREDYYTDYVRQLPTHNDHRLQWAAEHSDQVVSIGALSGSEYDDLWLVRTRSLAEAQTLVDSSPDVMRNLVASIEIFGWDPKWGEFSR